MWRRVGPVELTGPTAVQRPLEVLDAMGPHDAPALIWSTVTDTVLVVGRAGRDPILNRGVLEARGIPVVNRRSGGGPVLWDRGLLGLDVLVPRAHRLAPADVTLAYRWLGTAVAEALTRLGAQQRELLDGVAPVVRPGGWLVYATCSLEPEENEEQVNAFLARHPEFHRDPPADFPRELLSPAGDLTLLPHQHGLDGAFAARLQKDA